MLVCVFPGPVGVRWRDNVLLLGHWANSENILPNQQLIRMVIIPKVIRFPKNVSFWLLVSGCWFLEKPVTRNKKPVTVINFRKLKLFGYNRYFSLIAINFRLYTVNGINYRILNKSAVANLQSAIFADCQLPTCLVLVTQYRAYIKCTVLSLLQYNIFIRILFYDFLFAIGHLVKLLF